jgi:hypothetical protein
MRWEPRSEDEIVLEARSWRLEAGGIEVSAQTEVYGIGGRRSE